MAAADPTTTSARGRLARLALEAALATPGVLAPNAGPAGLHATWIDGERLAGVRVTAEAGGTWSVELGLTAEIIPLPALAEAVRVRVERAANFAGVGALVGDVDVAVLDVEGDRPGGPGTVAGTAAPPGTAVA